MCLERRKKTNLQTTKKKIRKTTHLPKHINERRTQPTHTHTHNRQKQIYNTQTQHKHGCSSILNLSLKQKDVVDYLDVLML